MTPRRLLRHTGISAVKCDGPKSADLHANTVELFNVEVHGRHRAKMRPLNAKVTLDAEHNLQFDQFGIKNGCAEIVQGQLQIVQGVSSIQILKVIGAIHQEIKTCMKFTQLAIDLQKKKQQLL